MSNMAPLAALHANARVLKDEGAAFIDMALEAGLFVIERRLKHGRTASQTPRGCGSPVRVVAIGALNHAFIHAVLRGHFEWRPLGSVARITKVLLHSGQQELRRGGFVDGVTGRADDLRLDMRGAQDVFPGSVSRMAIQTRAQRLFGSEIGESLDGRFVAGHYVIAAGSVTSLASRRRGVG